VKRRTVWTVLLSCLLTSVTLFLSVLIFAALLYAFFVLGHWFAKAYLFG